MTDLEEDEEEFYTAPTAASITKIEIVTKYFDVWSKILGPVSIRLAYQDLYSGPGRYKKDGTPSTPVLIVQKIISDQKLRSKVETFFNDANSEHVEELKKNLTSLPGYETLRFKPVVTNETVDKGFEQQLRQIVNIPTFSFVDPFGYKGVTLPLLRSMLRGFGCDLVLFFSFNRINAAITNDNVEDHMEALFGPETLKELRGKIANKSPAQRETIIVDTFAQELKKMGFRYVHPFTFMQADRNRVSHHLIFVSKSPLGYKVMKDITAKASSSHEEGVPSFGFAKPVSQDATPLLFEFARPLEQLGAMLMREYAGKTIVFSDLYDEHNVGRPYVERNYKDALKELEAEGKITVTTETKRRKGTLPNHATIIFPGTG